MAAKRGRHLPSFGAFLTPLSVSGASAVAIIDRPAQPAVSGRAVLSQPVYDHILRARPRGRAVRQLHAAAKALDRRLRH